MMRTKKPRPCKVEDGGALHEDELPVQKRTHEETDGDEDDRGKRRRTVLEKGEALVEVKVEGEEADLLAGPDDDDDDDASADEGEPQRFRRPLLMARRSGPALLSRPNPLTFARRKWITSAAPEDPPEIPEATASSSGQFSTDDDTELPDTPGDEATPHVAVAEEEDDLGDDDEGVESDDSAEQVYCRPKLSMKSGFSGALYKPKHLNMARRRWGPTVSPSPGSELAESSLSKPSSRASRESFTDLFEADDASLGAEDRAPSSEEVSLQALR